MMRFRLERLWEWSARKRWAAAAIFCAAIGALSVHPGLSPEPDASQPAARTLAVEMLPSPGRVVSVDKSDPQLWTAFHDAGDDPVLMQALALDGQAAILKEIELLERGRAWLQSVPGYTGVFQKQERIGDELQDRQDIDIRLAHAPFRVEMKWRTGDTGRQVVFAEGENDGKMVVRPGGLKGRLLPPLRISPTGSLALSESRHPVTQAGLLNLAGRLLENRRQDLKRLDDVACRLTSHVTHEDRICYRVEIAYASREANPVYRRTVHLIDESWSIPVSVQNYGWADEPKVVLTSATEGPPPDVLIESYGYSNLRFENQFVDRQADPAQETSRVQ